MTLKDFFRRIGIAKPVEVHAETTVKTDKTDSKMEDNALAVNEWIVKGINHEDAGEYDLAAEYFSKAADEGSAPAMHFMGNLFLFGKIGAREIQNLGIMPWHINESSIPDYENAFCWFLRAAEHDFPLAMLNVGNLYFYGKGTAKDDQKARLWLEMAMKHGQDRAYAAYYSFFGEKKHTSPTDEQYDNYLNAFKNKINQEDINECDRIMEKLLLGTEKQFFRMGMMLAKGYCTSNEHYHRYNLAQDTNKRLYAPVYPILRAEWASTFIVNLDAFDEEFPVIGFAVDVRCYPVPRKGLEIIDTVEREGKAFGWLPEKRTYTLMQVNRKTEMSVISPETLNMDSFELKQMEVHDKIMDYSTENTAFFFANPEKEYTIEIVHVNPKGDFIPILRYSG